MRGASADLQIDRLQECTTLPVPVGLQGEDHLLEGQHRRRLVRACTQASKQGRTAWRQSCRGASRRSCQTLNSIGFFAAASHRHGPCIRQGVQSRPRGWHVVSAFCNESGKHRRVLKACRILAVSVFVYSIRQSCA
ncbi:hypothetical protein RR42_m0582 [Cupriavidus basilensis]|uniref:Uncharacterized protein n=1 Tax=Cupriavidus basilensis TaxID=68895 RepID=A0A0C4Y4W7_9BURK|nr:hypothetical protein RR42_m0582 [Cupriavidus basilensis]